MKKLPLCLLVAALVAASGCTTTSSGMQQTRYTLAEQGTSVLPQKIIQLPVKITVNEISVGGVAEPVPQWSKTATSNVAAAVSQVVSSTTGAQFVPMPTLGTDEQSMVDEHLALYEMVAYSAYLHTGALGSEQAWPQKVARFDYTVGPGLKFLKEKTGADAALIVVGEDNESSSGRKAAFIIAAMFGIGLQLGYSGITAGIVNLDTGNVLWLDFAINQATIDLRTPQGSKELVEAAFQNFPGRVHSTSTKKP
ncbi:MAG: hypothetical protein U1F34_05295 [Gammaproteobacteria bacterium]